MEMETTDRLCCNCHHYRLGHLEEPCNQGNKKCGYLKEGCGKWEGRRERAEETPGEVKPVVLKQRYGKQRRKWTEEDDKVLREMYSSHSIRMIEVKLNRSRLSIYHRAQVIGLRR
jgi:hypothetical protein